MSVRIGVRSFLPSHIFLFYYRGLRNSSLSLFRATGFSSLVLCCTWAIPPGINGAHLHRLAGERRRQWGTGPKPNLRGRRIAISGHHVPFLCKHGACTYAGLFIFEHQFPTIGRSASVFFPSDFDLYHCDTLHLLRYKWPLISKHLVWASLSPPISLTAGEKVPPRRGSRDRRESKMTE